MSKYFCLIFNQFLSQKLSFIIRLLSIADSYVSNNDVCIKLNTCCHGRPQNRFLGLDWAKDFFHAFYPKMYSKLKIIRNCAHTNSQMSNSWFGQLPSMPVGVTPMLVVQNSIVVRIRLERMRPQTCYNFLCDINLNLMIQPFRHLSNDYLTIPCYFCQPVFTRFFSCDLRGGGEGGLAFVFKTCVRVCCVSLKTVDAEPSSPVNHL